MSSVPGKAPALRLPPEVGSASELLLEELGRLLTTEETLAKLVLPKLLLEVEDDELKQAVQEHLQETRDHAVNVRAAFGMLDAPPAGKPAYGLDGLRMEHDAHAPKVFRGVRGLVHCAAAMGTEHYEINAYEAAIRLADALGAEDVGGLLRANLEQEIGALEKLGAQADRLAQQAVGQPTTA